MREERQLEYERMVAEGKLESLKREGPGLWAQLFASVFRLGQFGPGALFTGINFLGRDFLLNQHKFQKRSTLKFVG